LCASWGFQQVAIKVANACVPPLLQAGIRSAGAALLVGLWMSARRQAVWQKDGTLWWGMAAGVLFAGEFLFIYWGLEYTNASRSVVLLYSAPFVVALGAHLFIPGERLKTFQVIGLGLAFAGIITAFGESLSLPTRSILIGDLMLAAAAIMWGATTVLIKAGPLAGIPAAKTLLYQLTVSAAVLLIGSWAKSERAVQGLTPLVFASLLYQTLWVAFVTYCTWFWLLRRYSPSRLAAFTFLTPLFGVLAGGWFLGEPLTGALLLALALVGSGIYLVNRRR
jgi:drug/metabolite transporter (DMT)-like permease